MIFKNFNKIPHSTLGDYIGSEEKILFYFLGNINK